jgi:hypothetical protein
VLRRNSANGSLAYAARLYTKKLDPKRIMIDTPIRRRMKFSM